MRGFEPPLSRPPDAHFNRTKLHPEKQISKALFCFIFAKIKFHSFPTMIKHIFSLFLLCLTINSYGQNKYTLSGYVKDNETGEYLIGASVFLEDMRKGTSTNQYGFYSITVEEGNYSIAFSFLGLKTEKRNIQLTKNTRLNISLESNAIITNEIVIESEGADKNVSSTNMSQVKIDVKNIKKLPAFMGEVDVLKTIQLLPGVQSSGEGNSGFYVRGGGPDQKPHLVRRSHCLQCLSPVWFFLCIQCRCHQGYKSHKRGYASTIWWSFSFRSRHFDERGK